MSKVRSWAEAQKELHKADEQVTLKALSDAIIYALSRFMIRDNSNKASGDFSEMAKKVRQKYNCDATLFELGCYLYFFIDYWHFNNRTQQERAEVVNYLISQFIVVFEDALNVNNLEIILQNRMDLYGKITREEKDKSFIKKACFYLGELIIKTANNTIPITYDFDKPLPVFLEAMEKTIVTLSIQGFLIHMVPASINSIKGFYNLISESGK